MTPRFLPGKLPPHGVWIRVVAAVVITTLIYIAALWLRWGGMVPQALWGQMYQVVPAGVLGMVVAGSLVGLFRQGQSWSTGFYAAFVTSLLSVTVAMAATFALRVTAIPRLTFVVAFFLLWAGLATMVVIMSRRQRRLAESHQDVTLLPFNEVGSSETDGVLSALQTCSQLTVETPGVYELVMAGARVQDDNDRLTLYVEPKALQWPYPLAKRGVDILLSLLGLLMGLPLGFLVALAIKLDSPGPVFYLQTRVGKGGCLFCVVKFRTMVDGAEAETGPVLAVANDPRVTRVGRVLRALRLDEVPQLINVLRGDMSLVGPRPERPEFVEQFRESIKGYELRHLVRPGITGLAQIRGRYDSSAEEKLRFDLAYIFLWSPILDLKVILQTVGIMLTPERARGTTEPVSVCVTQEVAAADNHIASKSVGGDRRGATSPVTKVEG